MCPFSPMSLLFKIRQINGFQELLVIPVAYLIDFINETCEEYSDWDEEQGFGSSDMTYAAKSCIDNVIAKYFPELKTVFNPSLSIVKK